MKPTRYMADGSHRLQDAMSARWQLEASMRRDLLMAAIRQFGITVFPSSLTIAPAPCRGHPRARRHATYLVQHTAYQVLLYCTAYRMPHAAHGTACLVPHAISGTAYEVLDTSYRIPHTGTAYRTTTVEGNIQPLAVYNTGQHNTCGTTLCIAYSYYTTPVQVYRVLPSTRILCYLLCNRVYINDYLSAWYDTNPCYRVLGIYRL